MPSALIGCRGRGDANVIGLARNDGTGSEMGSGHGWVGTYKVVVLGVAQARGRGNDESAKHLEYAQE